MRSSVAGWILCEKLKKVEKVAFLTFMDIENAIYIKDSKSSEQKSFSWHKEIF